MEIIGVILLIVAINVVWRLIVSGGTAAVQTVQGKGSFGENMSAQRQGMGPLEMRKVDFQAGDEGEGPHGIALEIRGLIPVSKRTKLAFVTSVIDMTDSDNPYFVLSEIEHFQEPDSTAYQFHQDGAEISPDQGFVGWTRAGVVFPELLYPAHSGARNLAFVMRLVDLDRMPAINLGFCDSDHPGVVASLYVHHELEYDGTGFSEAAEHRDEARTLSIRLGVAIAFADGSLDESEGNVIKEWVQRVISPFEGERREELKELYNNAMRSAYADARAGELTLSEATNRMNEIAEEPQKYEAIELCFDVMAADGLADETEMDSIRRIAEALDLNYEEIESLRDKTLIELDVDIDHQASLETIVGIQEDWSQEQTKVYIRTEFAKWNDRLNNLPEGQERDNAQRMLEMLSEARKKYA
jgi:uncharacterized tellurite resistance protein B-like protein